MQSETGKRIAVSLNGGQKRFLRGLGHHLQPVVYLGKEGISENLALTAREAFKTRELIKVKIGQNCETSREEVTAALIEMTGSALVQLIGRTIVLYLPNKKLKSEQRITLPA